MKSHSFRAVAIGTVASFVAVASFTIAAAQAQTTLEDSVKQQSLALTIYNDNRGVVRDVRQFEIPGGTSEVKMRGVASGIDPTSVKITPLKHPKDLVVLEQNYQYDLVSQAKLLEKYIDHTVGVVDDKGVRTEGTLLSLEDNKLTLRTATGIVMLPNLARYTVDVPQLPAGLITQPTLVWKFDARERLSAEPLEVVYETGGLDWHAEYIAALSADDKSLDLTGWVNLDNTSGASYTDAKVKLVAGAVHRPEPKYRRAADESADMAFSANAKVQEHAMFEYHVYELPQLTTVRNNESKQVSMLEASAIKASKHYTYFPQGTDVNVTIDFQNSEANHLGMPLPMGTIRVMKRDNDGALELVGADNIAHTPRDEKVTLNVGTAFDLKGATTITDSHSYSHSSQQSYSIKLSNHKDEDVVIDVVQYEGENWEITKSSMDYDKKDANTIVFHVPVKARGDATVTYTVYNTY